MSIINIPVIDINNELPISMEISVAPEEWSADIFNGFMVYKTEKSLDNIDLSNYSIRYLPGENNSTIEQFDEFDKITLCKCVNGYITFLCFETAPQKTVYIKLHLIPK